eukprot:2813002-Pyramimonas_sp.AAC.1
MRKCLAKEIYRLRGQVPRMRPTAKLNEALRTKRFPGRPKARSRIPELNWTRDDVTLTATTTRQKSK